MDALVCHPIVKVFPKMICFKRAYIHRKINTYDITLRPIFHCIHYLPRIFSHRVLCILNYTDEIIKLRIDGMKHRWLYGKVKCSE